MSSSEVLKNAIFPYIEKYNFTVSVAGVRYGSVAYIGFGEDFIEKPGIRFNLIYYPVEIEFGADFWTIMKDDRFFLYSRFQEINVARVELEELFIGRKIIDIEIINNKTILYFEDNVLWISEICSDPASGFLHSFQTENEPVWETVDGIVLQV